MMPIRDMLKDLRQDKIVIERLNKPLYGDTYTVLCVGQSDTTALTLSAIEKAKAHIESIKPEPMPEIITSKHLTRKIMLKTPKKKNNRRWMKKYKKKYQKEEPDNCVYMFYPQAFSFIGGFKNSGLKKKIIVAHPELVSKIVCA